ncbi:MBOAT family O-acyltransferase [Undibacterium cyanobacteriorum]|uniref:Probable alginate O-acetylase AlgI n=1 Tax=Undibacterium cyanobacteriorum TaxID=3073561 RepID=A0ABY9RIB4_9BURK|nr:MBOAT family O-acyltransferase [Undibacterium sp. 20NA77.5]WMW80599.1 MBOAT family O-acyltransferase [Undibacterium sp. 20NA77.5]
MSYLSPEFALTFLVFLFLYWGLKPWPQWQKISLLLASYGIYASLDWRFSTILAVYTVCMLGLFKLVQVQAERRRLWCGVGIFASVLNLAVFKYYDFCSDGFLAAAEYFQLAWTIPALEILLPVGISFYTFQAIAYLVAIARREREPANALDSALYLAFFPTLFAGPICRASDLLVQIEEKAPRKLLHMDLIFWLLLSALVKKVWLATWISETWVNPLFANPDAYQAPELLMGAYAFAIQIYFDFSGYSDLVIAMSLLLGYQLKDNFNYPYLAANLREFWRRWHISLSSWIRDYVYIPMGGSRNGWWMTQVTIVSSMVISGIWHGASLKYIIWGALHGLGMVAQNIIEKLLGRQTKGWLSAVITFHFVCFAWIFFRADGWQEALQFICGFVRLDAPMSMDVLGAAALMLLFFVASVQAENWKSRSLCLMERLPILSKPVLLCSLALLIHLLGPSGVPSFLYYSY